MLLLLLLLLLHPPPCTHAPAYLLHVSATASSLQKVQVCSDHSLELSVRGMLQWHRHSKG